METSTKPAGSDMVRFLNRLQVDTLREQDALQLKLCIADTVGCLLGGLATDAAAVMKAYATASASAGPCTVAGVPSGVGPAIAALANGTIAHALIFDDMHRHSKLHPGVVVLPVVMALAQSEHAISGAAILNAVAAGYEVAARVGVALDLKSHRQLGWRATGTAGSFGAAMAACRLLGLSDEQAFQAMAAAAAQASGTFAFQEHGGSELYLAAGTAARNGVTAALLAQSGFLGAYDPFCAQDGGYLRAASTAAHPDALDERLGELYRFRDVCVKMHPTCHSTQTGIDAALLLRENHRISLEDVDHIEVRAGEITRLQCGWNYEPGPPEKMIFHMGYAIGLALRSGRVVPADYDGTGLPDPAVERIARNTRVIADPELTAIYQERKPCIVTVHLRSGATLTERVDFCIGEPENPATLEAVQTKFLSLAEERLPAGIAATIFERLMLLEQERDFGDLVRQLANAH